MGVKTKFAKRAGEARDRAISSIGGVTKKELEQRVNEAIDLFAAGEDEPTKYGYRGYGQAIRDLLAGRHRQALQAVWSMYISNPLAKRLLELKRDFVVGEGITYAANDGKVQEVLDKFWNDPVNNFDRWTYQMALELGLWGEQIYPVFVRTGEDVGGGDGRVRCGIIDPLRVRKVVTDPENARVKTEVRVVGPKNKTLRYKIIRRDEDPKSDTNGYLMGLGSNDEGFEAACFLFSVNSLSNSTRGIPDLLANADWLDQYDQYLFNVLEREAFISYFVWDLEMKGATKDQIQARLKELGMPKPGSVLGHNEKELWKVMAPDLKQAGSAIAGRQILTHIVGTAGFPEHWFGSGEAATRATAKEMGEPTLKSLASRQRYFKHILVHMMDFAIDQAVLAKTLQKEVDRKFSVNMPDISVRDTGTAATALVQVAQALLIAEQQRWIPREKAVELFGQVATQLGVEIDVQEMMEAEPGSEEYPPGDGQGKLEEALKIVEERVAASKSR